MGKGRESNWQISDKGIREEQRKRGTLKNKSARVGMPLASVCRWDHFQTHYLETGLVPVAIAPGDSGRSRGAGYRQPLREPLWGCLAYFRPRLQENVKCC